MKQKPDSLKTINKINKPLAGLAGRKRHKSPTSEMKQRLLL